MTAQGSNVERNLARILLALLFAACLLVLLPFVSSLLWAIVICYATWPLHEWLVRRLGGRRSLAAALMTLSMVVAVLLPFAAVGMSLADNVAEISGAMKALFAAGPPKPPAWLVDVPLAGRSLDETWRALASDGGKLWQAAKGLVEPVGTWLLGAGLALGGGLMQLALSILMAFFLFRDGQALGDAVTSAVGRIGGDEGRHLLDIAGKTVRGVVHGILGTAMVQAAMSGIGFAVAGVPGAGLLALLTFFLSVVPVGPPLVWLPAALWLYHTGQSGWGTFMIAWGIAVSSVDNIVKPWLISQGSTMPFVLIFMGVLGGAMAFGFIGVFLGPTVLAVGYRLVGEWVAVRGTAAGGAAAPTPGADAPPAPPARP